MDQTILRNICKRSEGSVLAMNYVLLNNPTEHFITLKPANPSIVLELANHQIFRL